MYQFFSKPDRYVGGCGHLECAVAEHTIARAPAFMRGVRALFITDPHVRPRTSEADIAAFAGRIAALKPDILLWGGDFADKAPDARRLIAGLQALRPPLGSFAVPGNNDREAWPDIARLRAALAASGIRLLVNEACFIPVEGGTLAVGGVDEHHYGAPETCDLFPDAPRPDCYRVLLSHYPVLPPVMPDLMLSGHTHGGQFNLLGITPYTIGFERVFARRRASRYIAGLHSQGDAQVLVGKGIGASRVPLRVGVRPEMDLLRFA